MVLFLPLAIFLSLLLRNLTVTRKGRSQSVVWKKKSVGLGCNDESRLAFTSLWKHQKLVGLSEERERDRRKNWGWVTLKRKR
jgi:hypothetical protein